MNARLLAIAICCATMVRSVSADDRAGIEFFENEVRPLLVEHCQKCHEGASDPLQGGLRLDHRAGWETGGDSGPAIVPGQPDASLLIQAVRYDGPVQMPPAGKLSPAQISVLEKWVSLGAPDPRTESVAPAAGARVIDLEEGRQFWSFQPLADPGPPAVENIAWVASPLDRFILAELEAHALRPAPPADKRTLLRRATLELTGLPPTPEEVAEFLADNSPQAFEKVVDRLLASPRYGERWGRHWLDVARYADSNGLDENVAHGNAWRYRDWVVGEFNRDRPYDEFLRRQVAGDLITKDGDADRYDGLIATGFLSLGPKVLAEADKVKMEMDIIDEQVDTVGRALLGLTMGCARCHDHKFDPIPTSDYYALAGIFKSTKTMESLVTIAKWNENPIPTANDLEVSKAHAAQVQTKKQAIDAAVQTATETLQATLGAGAAMPENPETQFPEETKTALKAMRDELAKLEKEAPEISAAMGVCEGAAADLPVHIRGSHLTLGEVSRRGFPQVLVSAESQPALEDGQSGRRQLADWLASEENPLTARVMVNRLWRWRFGRGLVASTDNFGALGEKPSHPKLLDWLASRFIESGWSIKAMHRMMMLSNTYAMSSAHDARAMEIDPENKWLWRHRPRRFEVEAIRDSLLATGGLLDLSIGGSLLHVKNREFFFDHTSKDTTNYDTRRRSLYLPVVRNNVYDLFQLYDFPDPAVVSGDRATSTIAPQALFMLNAEIVVKASEALTASLMATSEDDASRVQSLYERVLCREATAAEVDRALKFLNDSDDRDAAWRSLCQTLLICNEFLTSA